MPKPSHIFREIEPHRRLSWQQSQNFPDTLHMYSLVTGYDWYRLGRYIRTHILLINFFNVLRTTVLEEWEVIPQEETCILTDSMLSRL